MMNARKHTGSLCSILAGGALLMVLTVAWADDKKVEGAKAPPKGAVVLFNGKDKDLSGWVTRDGKPAKWKINDDYMEVQSSDIMTKEKFGPDFQLHVEFWLPLLDKASGEGRANSGVYLQGRYEVQVVDSYKNDTDPQGSVGALYGTIAPNKEAQQKAVKPPQQWNTYDITFHAPRVDDKGKVTKNGRLTVVLNGVTLIDDGKFNHPTGGALDGKIGQPGPLLLQDHGCKVRYRNIWLQPLSGESDKK
jgi:Domain of Unknown Function (DUF1080)